MGPLQCIGVLTSDPISFTMFITLYDVSDKEQQLKTVVCIGGRTCLTVDLGDNQRFIDYPLSQNANAFQRNCTLLEFEPQKLKKFTKTSTLNPKT